MEKADPAGRLNSDVDGGIGREKRPLSLATGAMMS